MRGIFDSRDPIDKVLRYIFMAVLILATVNYLLYGTMPAVTTLVWGGVVLTLPRVYDWWYDKVGRGL